MLALIAGRGALPGAIVAGLPDAPLICALAGQTPDLAPAITFRLEQLGTLIAQLRTAGVTQVCMAGGITRPQIDPAQIDAATQPASSRKLGTRCAKPGCCSRARSRRPRAAGSRA